MGFSPIGLINLPSLITGKNPAYKRSITIDHTQCGGSLTSFPVLVSLSDSTLRHFTQGGHVQNVNGYDIKFYSDSALTSILNWEIEYYNGNTGTLVAWVNMSVSSTINTIFYISYGDPTIGCSLGNSTSVWDNNYKGVWHLGNGTIISGLDSTSNKNNGIINGVTATTGKIGGAGNFVAANSQFIDLGNNTQGSSLDISGKLLTVSCWINLADVLSEYKIVSRWSSSNQQQYLLDFNLGDGKINFLVGDGTGYGQRNSGSSLSAGTWIYYVGVNQTTQNSENQADTNAIQSFLNSTSDGTVSWSVIMNSVTSNVFIGKGGDTANYFNGKIDEVRISNIARPQAWITTEYNNQNNPGNIGSPAFYTVGSEVIN